MLLIRQGAHSHSIVPGGLLVMSYRTRLTPDTSLQMRAESSLKHVGEGTGTSQLS